MASGGAHLDIDAARHELRDGEGASLQRRRWIGALSALAVVDFAIISLYQLGVIRHLPDPPGKVFDSDRVNASRSAYPLGVPDGTLGLTMHGVTMALAGAGGSARTGRHPAFDVLLGAIALAGAVSAGLYLREMITKQKRACPYCLTAAATEFATLALATPDVRSGLRALGTRTR